MGRVPMLVDTEDYIMTNKFWNILALEWGQPVDLDEEYFGMSFSEASTSTPLKKKTRYRRVDISSSNLALDKTTFGHIGKLRRNRAKMSSYSLLEIYAEIDRCFRPIFAKKSRCTPKQTPIIEHSASFSGLSFDDTVSFETVGLRRAIFTTESFQV